MEFHKTKKHLQIKKKYKIGFDHVLLFNYLKSKLLLINKHIFEIIFGIIKSNMTFNVTTKIFKLCLIMYKLCIITIYLFIYSKCLRLKKNAPLMGCAPKAFISWVERPFNFFHSTLSFYFYLGCGGRSRGK